jgi:hypothetical protein
LKMSVLTLCPTIKFDWTGEGLRYLTFLMLPQDGHILLCCQVEGLILVESQEDEVSDADRLGDEGLHCHNEGNQCYPPLQLEVLPSK